MPEDGVCFGSLAYCCGLEKKCPVRDAAIKKLGLTKKEYATIKKASSVIFQHFARMKKTYSTVANARIELTLQVKQ